MRDGKDQTGYGRPRRTGGRAMHYTGMDASDHGVRGSAVPLRAQ